MPSFNGPKSSCSCTCSICARASCTQGKSRYLRWLLTNFAHAAVPAMVQAPAMTRRFESANIALLNILPIWPGPGPWLYTDGALSFSLSLSSLSITLRCRSVQLKHLKVLSPPFNRDKIEPCYVYVYICIYIYIYTYRIQYGLVVKFHSLNLLRSVPDCSHVWHLLTRESLRVPSGLMINLPC